MAAMAVEIPFVREMRFAYGEAGPVSPLVRRVVARNPSLFTLHGTNTYLVGRGRVVVIDPGPSAQGAPGGAAAGPRRGDGEPHPGDPPPPGPLRGGRAPWPRRRGPWLAAGAPGAPMPHCPATTTRRGWTESFTPGPCWARETGWRDRTGPWRSCPPRATPPTTSASPSRRGRPPLHRRPRHGLVHQRGHPPRRRHAGLRGLPAAAAVAGRSGLPARARPGRHRPSPLRHRAGGAPGGAGAGDPVGPGGRAAPPSPASCRWSTPTWIPGSTPRPASRCWLTCAPWSPRSGWPARAPRPGGRVPPGPLTPAPPGGAAGRCLPVPAPLDLAHRRAAPGPIPSAAGNEEAR